MTDYNRTVFLSGFTLFITLIEMFNIGSDCNSLPFLNQSYTLTWEANINRGTSAHINTFSLNNSLIFWIVVFDILGNIEMSSNAVNDLKFDQP